MKTVMQAEQPIVLYRRREEQLRMFFSLSVSLLLFFTATAKFCAVIQHRPFLFVPDPVFSFTTEMRITWVSMLLEYCATVFIFFNRRYLSAMVACSWLASLFVCYRMLAYAFFAKKPCPCLGRVLDWTGLSQAALDAIPIIILCYMGIGSLLFLLLSNLEVPINDSEI